MRFNYDVVITQGFRDDPNLGLLDEASWRLEVMLDEEELLETTHLYALTFGGWATIFVPPWPFGGQMAGIPTKWQVEQRRADLDGNTIDRAKTQLAVAAILDVIPLRFHGWLIDTTEECLRHLEDEGLEVGALDPEFGVDETAALLADISTLKGELLAGREHREAIRRRQGRYYGDVFLYDFVPGADLEWRLGKVEHGTEVLIVGPVNKTGSERALFPPDELTSWRWTAPDRPDNGGEYLGPSEVMAKVPPEFRGWVAAKSHEALQRTRHVLHDMGRRTLANADDFAQVAKLARHAHRLAGFSRGSGMSYPGAPPLGDEDHVAETQSPDGRTVLLFMRTWRHILQGHPEMSDHLDDLLSVVEEPDHREPDPRIDRERFYRRGGPEAWVRVVVEMAGPIDRIVTAFPQANPPERWRNR